MPQVFLGNVIGEIDPDSLILAPADGRHDGAANLKTMPEQVFQDLAHSSGNLDVAWGFLHRLRRVPHTTQGLIVLDDPLVLRALAS